MKRKPFLSFTFAYVFCRLSFCCSNGRHPCRVATTKGKDPFMCSRLHERLQTIPKERIHTGRSARDAAEGDRDAWEVQPPAHGLPLPPPSSFPSRSTRLASPIRHKLAMTTAERGAA
eukprot:2053941-Rhodomonas_salina.1